jgi:tetratricopeptide (TPR) repeat protein
VNTLKRLLIIMLFLLVTSNICFAETREIIAEGTYTMGDGETPLIAEERALLVAKRTALEQAGTYVQSYSETRNYQLTTDEVQVIASGIMEVTILDKHRTIDGSSIAFWVKIKALVTTDKIEDMAAKIKDTSMTEDYKKLQEEYNQSQQQITALKQQLQQATADSDKQEIRNQIANSETKFQADTLFEQGNQSMANHQYQEAINAYTEAISQNPSFGRAYLRRGAAYMASSEYREAIQDFNQAILINPHFTLAYLGKGNSYENLGRKQSALQSYRLVIEYATPDQQRYIDMARSRIRSLESSDSFDSSYSPRHSYYHEPFFRRRNIY